jgi:hypothetical protein
MHSTHRIRPSTAIALALALGWAAFARWIVPPLLLAEHPGPLIHALKQYLRVPAVLFLVQDPQGRWREFSDAVLIAMVLHLTVVGILRWYDRPTGGARSPDESRASWRSSLALATAAAAFLAVAILAGARQDYFFFLQIWFHVRRGDDPWFLVPSMDGIMPLNAYGPLFNLLGPLAWINPLAPKLLFAYAYIVFAIAQIKGFAFGRPPSGRRALGLAALFWNPFVWVEIAFYGHLDILVGLACVGAVRAWERGRDRRAGALLAAGVLLKYLPIVLLPFLALDRGRPRTRFLFVALAAIALGLWLSYQVWGLSTFSALKLAATRRSTTLSIFYYLRAAYSPLLWLGIGPSVDYLEPWVQFLAQLRIWSWSRVRRPGVEASASISVATVVLLYRVGYPQYQMVPLVLASTWVLGQWERLRHRTALVAAMAGYFGWLSAFGLYYMLHDAWQMSVGWFHVQAIVGLPTFLLGCGFLIASVRAASPSIETKDPVG